MEKTIILKLNGNEYELLKEPNLGDIVVFTGIGQIVNIGEEEDGLIFNGQMLAAVVDVVPNWFKVFDDSKEPKEIF